MTTIKDMRELIADILDPARWKRQSTVMTLAVHTGQFRAWRDLGGLDDGSGGDPTTVAELRPTTFTRLLRDAKNAEADRDRYADVLHRIASGSIPAAGAAQEAYDALDGATPGEDTLAHVAGERDNAYTERAALVAFLAAVYPSALDTHDGWTVVYVQTPNGQMSWRIAAKDVDLFAHVPWGGITWDGHTTEGKYRRLAELVRTWYPASTARSATQDDART